MTLYTSASAHSPDPDAQTGSPAHAGPATEAVPAEVPAPVAAVPTTTGRHAVRGKALLPLVVSVLVAFVVATGYLMFVQPRSTDTLGRWGSSPAAVPVQPSEDMDGAPNPFRTVPSDLSGPPTRLRVKAIGVDTSLETLRLGPGGELQPPKTYGHAGWYADGTAPGDVGPAVLAGHVDSKQGPAVFYRLREVEAGDRIEVTRGGRTVSFTVTSTAWYPKRAFPAEQVYGPTPDRQLRLITCGGVFDRSLRSYRDNLVIYAVAG